MTIEVARDYIRRGWSVLPLPHRGKRPDIGAWQQLRVTEADLRRYFGGRRLNIGVLLGPPSNWLIDVDLDHALALELAPVHLAPTSAVFGRRSKPRSHWLYYASRPITTRQWRLPRSKQMVVELRSRGGQTVFPGSVHPSGESIEWHCDGEPQPIDPGVLEAQLQALYSDVCQRLGVSLPKSDHGRLHTAARAPTRIVERAARYLAKLPPAVSGQGGHDATFYAACTLVLGFGLDREAALGLLKQWNECCQPPRTERELEHKVDDALKKPGWRRYLLARPSRRDAACSAIERANRHAIEHRRKARRKAPA